MCYRLLLKLLSVSLHFHENISFILFLSNSMMKPNVKPYAVSTERVLLAGSLFLVLFHIGLASETELSLPWFRVEPLVELWTDSSTSGSREQSVGSLGKGLAMLV